MPQRRTRAVLTDAQADDGPPASEARADWEARIGRRSDAAATPRPTITLPAPARLRAQEGVGHVTLHWEPVEGAAGYLVHRALTPDSPFVPIDHGGQDVLAVPHEPYVDTTGPRGRPVSYAVAAVAAADAEPGPLSDPVEATAASATAGGTIPEVRVVVDASRAVGRLQRLWRPMIGSEHLSLLLYGRGAGGHHVGEELAEALRRARTELGVAAVRAHAILDDELEVYREVDGQPVHDFSRVDAVYDRLLELDLRPVVEFSFMPRDLARDPDATVFQYGAIISPPRDWQRWEDLIRAFVSHVVERYGRDEVIEHWAFEVWNEANLEVFWAGTKEEYWRLYDVTARAVKAVDDRLSVGGPGSAAAGWIGDLVTHVNESGSPLGFLSPHTYGNLPLDVKAEATARGMDGIPVWWTEWGVSPTHFADINDGPFGAPFIARCMKATQGRAEALAYWVVSDHFEELGTPPRLFHGGFGLLTVGNLRKPRWWALDLLERLGDDLVPVAVTGDGGGGLVDALATRRAGGGADVLVWNGTLDQSRATGDETLARTVKVSVDGLGEGGAVVSHWRVDAEHSNPLAVWRDLGSPDWPDDGQWAQLRSADQLAEYTAHRVSAGDESAEVTFDLPMPGLSFVRIEAGGHRGA